MMKDNFIRAALIVLLFSTFSILNPIFATPGVILPGLHISSIQIPQEDLTITGFVRTPTGSPLFGVSISTNTSNRRVHTDKHGAYKIVVPKNAILTFSLQGYSTHQISAISQNMDVVLRPDEINEKATPILYGRQTNNSLIQSTATVSGTDLQKIPSSNLTNSLTGRLVGLSVFQTGGGRPGADLASLSLRGNSPLYIIDGVPRDYTTLDPEQIESITVLKDGLATALYGQRASQGVILIKTRSGEAGKQQISFTAQAGIQTAVKQPRPLGAYDYAVLYNEGLDNEGRTARYTQTDLDAWKTKSDPLFHPDIDWYNTILKPNSLFSRYNLNITGGGNSAKYFVDLDYLEQGGILRTDPKNTYSTNTDYKRYLIRTNIDIIITPTTVLNLNLFGRIQNGTQPGGVGANDGAFTTSTTLSSFGSNNIFQELATTPNSAYPVFNPNGTLAGSSDYQTNLWGASTQSGYFFNSTRDASADVSVKKSLDAITSGLWVKALASFNSSVSENNIRTKRYPVYKLLRVSPDTSYQTFGQVSQQINLSTIIGQSRILYTDVSVGLNKEYGKHSIKTLLTANTQSSAQPLVPEQSVTTSKLIPEIHTNIATRSQYMYAEKYMGELSLSYSGFNRYKEGKRFGFFFGVGAGWNLHKEPFLKGVSWLNTLKLRGSYAYTGYPSFAGFAYNQYYTGGSSYNFGSTATAASGVGEATPANPNITWEKAKQINIGIDASFWDNKFSIKADYFNNKYYDLLQQRGSNVALFGVGFPSENLGINRYSGWELEAIYTSKIGNGFQYFIAPMLFSLQKNIVFQDEISRPYPWMVRTGQREDQTFGYVADGLFQSVSEINASAKLPGYLPFPGDIKYKDLNADGIINEFDTRALKNNNPVWSGALHLGFTYKGLDFSALLQGVANRYIYLSGNTEWAFRNNGQGQAFQHHLGRWTPTTATTATHPRISIGTNVNNELTSSYWLEDGSYLRLKTIELGYTLPELFSQKLGLTSARFFFNGINLFAFTKVDRVDPESPFNGYPIQKVINTGINIKF